MTATFVVVDNGSPVMKDSFITVCYEVSWHDSVVRPSLKMV